MVDGEEGSRCADGVASFWRAVSGVMEAAHQPPRTELEQPVEAPQLGLDYASGSAIAAVRPTGRCSSRRYGQ